VALATDEQAPQEEGKKRATMLMTILLSVLFILFVLMLLAALVYTLVRLVYNAGTRDAVAAGDDGQQPFLKASVLHVILRGGR
jgi:flagellar biosynthesis/type III secretory pathway M-ring protein FliF/YscJ